MSDRGAYRGIRTVLIDGPDYQALSSDARLVFLTLKLNLGPTGIDVLYPSVLEVQTGLARDAVARATADLERAGWVACDRNVIWIIDGLRYEPSRSLDNPNHVKEVRSHLKALPRLSILDRFRAYYDIDGEPPRPDFAAPMAFECHSDPIGKHGVTENGGTEERRTDERTTENGVVRASAPSAPLALVRVEPAPMPVAVQHTAVAPARSRAPGRPGRTHEELKHAIAAEFDDLAEQTARRRSVDDLRRFQAEIAFTYWQTVFDKRRAIYDAKRERLLLARLVEAPLGEGLSTLLYAIDGARADPYVRDKRGGDLAAIVCDRSHVEEFAGKSKAHERGDVHPRALKFVAAVHGVPAPGQEVAAHAS